MVGKNNRGEDDLQRRENASSSNVSSDDEGADFWSSKAVVKTTQKLLAEAIGTFFVIFTGCGAVTVNKIYSLTTFPGIAITWGLIVMIMVYTVGHISGAHFNPAVTVTMALFRRFPLKEVPMYMAAQLVGALLASGTLCLLFDIKHDDYFGTLPVGPHLRSFIMEIVATFLLMFVVSAVATDSRAIGELSGIAVGSTILLDVLVAGPVSGASMNPTRSLAPAIMLHRYEGIWVYILGPFIGAISGGFAYNLLRPTNKPLRELIGSESSIMKNFSKNNISRSNDRVEGV
ncbi:hypothetical protein Sjap_024867 [Stephania japonica]|uniref:Aquaporin NIP-type n=1 Tax=Stephania japonica TaxID=461633 RepID=A0AAP0EE49_9MAGN